MGKVGRMHDIPQPCLSSTRQNAAKTRQGAAIEDKTSCLALRQHYTIYAKIYKAKKGEMDRHL